jgi:hypothetical protein
MAAAELPPFPCRARDQRSRSKRRPSAQVPFTRTLAEYRLVFVAFLFAEHRGPAPPHKPTASVGQVGDVAFRCSSSSTSAFVAPHAEERVHCAAPTAAA